MGNGRRNSQPPDRAGVIGEADVAAGFFQDAFAAIEKLDGGDDADRDRLVPVLRSGILPWFVRSAP